MKITDIKAVYPKYKHLAPSWRTHFWQIVVRVDTDAGVTGYGYGGGGVAGVAVVNGHLRDLLVGREIESVADIQRLTTCCIWSRCLTDARAWA